MESHTLGSGDGEQGSDGERKPAQMQLQNNYSRDVYVEAPYAVKTEGNNKSYLSHSDSAHARISGEGVQRIHGIAYDGCPHVIYVEIIHLGRYPQSSNANEQWQCRAQRILHNLKVQCGYLWTEGDANE